MQKNSDTLQQKTSDGVAVNPTIPPKPRHHKRLVTLFFILTMALLGAIAYLKMTKQALQIAQNNSIQQIEASLNSLAQQQKALHDNFNNTNQQIQRQQHKLQQQINGLINDVKSEHNTEAAQQAWLLNQARDVLELAQNNLRWNNHQEDGMILLQEADALLQQITDERLDAVKQQIAKEIASLKSIPSVDVADLIKKLNNAETAITLLPQKPLTLNPISQPKQGSWNEPWQASLNLLEKLVIVRHHLPDEASQLSPLHQLVTREQITINLQEAQWALLHNHPKLYQQSLAQVITSIHHGYATNNTQVEALMTQIQQLQQVKLITTKLDITPLINELNDIINSSPSRMTTIPKINSYSPQQGSHLP